MYRVVAIVTALMLTFSAVLTPWHSRTAQASEVWCWDDPVLEINGQIVSIDLGVRLKDVATVTGAEIVVAVPEGVSARIVSLETRWFTPTVRFVASSDGGSDHGHRNAHASFDAKVDVLLNASTTFDYKIDVVSAHDHGTRTEHHVARSNQHEHFELKINGDHDH